MKKRVYGKKLSRGRGSRKALYRSLIKALVENGSIKTTKSKAETVQGNIDVLVNMAKDNSLAKRRMLDAKLANDTSTAKKLVDVIAERLKGRNSGYTRMIPLPQRRGDMAEMVRLEWVVTIKNELVSKTKTEEVDKNKKTSITERLKSVANRGRKVKTSEKSKTDKETDLKKKK